MDGLVDKIVDFYNNNKELSIAIAGALVGIIGTWIFNKLGPWIGSMIKSVLELIGRLIGGHFAYAGIRRRYLNWVVLQNQDLNLTGIIATGEKPKLEQVFISLKVMDEDKETENDDTQSVQRRRWLAKFSTTLASIAWGELFRKVLLKNEKLTVSKVSTSLFSKKPLWRLSQFFSRPVVSDSLLMLLAGILLIALPAHGLFGTSDINNWEAGLSAGVWTLLIALLLSVLKDDFDWMLVLVFVIIPISVFAYTIKVRILDAQQSPFAILIGTLIAIFLVVFSAVIDKISLSRNEITAKEVGKLLDSSDCIAILGRPGSGKSTYAQFIALTFAQDKAGQARLRKHHIAKARFGCKKWYLPILIPLRKVQGIKDKQTSQNLLLEAFRQNVLPSEVRDILHIEFLRYMLNKMSCLLIFDGLDWMK